MIVWNSISSRADYFQWSDYLLHYFQQNHLPPLQTSVVTLFYVVEKSTERCSSSPNSCDWAILSSYSTDCRSLSPFVVWRSLGRSPTGNWSNSRHVRWLDAWHSFLSNTNEEVAWSSRWQRWTQSRRKWPSSGYSSLDENGWRRRSRTVPKQIPRKV